MATVLPQDGDRISN